MVRWDRATDTDILLAHRGKYKDTKLFVHAFAKPYYDPSAKHWGPMVLQHEGRSSNTPLLVPVTTRRLWMIYRGANTRHLYWQETKGWQ